MENSNEVKTWADIMDTPEKRTVQEVIVKSLKEKDNEEKERQNRRRNIIVFELPESKESEPEDRKEVCRILQRQNQDEFSPQHDRACNQTG